MFPNVSECFLNRLPVNRQLHCNSKDQPIRIEQPVSVMYSLEYNILENEDSLASTIEMGFFTQITVTIYIIASLQFNHLVAMHFHHSDYKV